MSTKQVVRPPYLATLYLLAEHFIVFGLRDLCVPEVLELLHGSFLIFYTGTSHMCMLDHVIGMTSKRTVDLFKGVSEGRL